MSYPKPLTSFVVRVVHAQDEVRITVQNLQTKRLFELTSWHDLVWVLQQPPICASSTKRFRHPEEL